MSCDQATQPSGSVLVGYDGSEEARQAVEWAAAEAELRDRSLVLVHSTDWNPTTAGPGPTMTLPAWDGAELVRDSMRIQLQDIAAEVRRARPGLVVHLAMPEGPPDFGLVTIADEVSPALIAVGASGAGALGRTLLGSTATALVRRTPWPAVVVRQAGAATGPVVVGLDGSATSDRAAEFAFTFASAHGSTVRAVHVEPASTGSASLGAWPGDTAAYLDAAADTVDDQIRTWLERCPDVPVETEHVSGRPARALLDRARDAALLVVGSHGRGAFRRLVLGSVSHHVVHHAPCPVAVLRTATAELR